MHKFVRTLIAAAALAFGGTALAAGEAPTPPDQEWSFEGVFGTYDRAALQRGLQVYTEVCAACHALHHVYYRHLSGIGFNEDEIKAFAANFQVMGGPNDQGEMVEREALPTDRFKAPYPNPQAARAANNGAYPPDLSLMAKARANGPDYIYALLTGYTQPPDGFEMQPGMHYNAYFPGHQIAMAKPLNDGQITYTDGTEASLDQMARDLTQFLMWAAEPKLEERKSMGVKVMAFLFVLAGLLIVAKRRIWARLEDH